MGDRKGLLTGKWRTAWVLAVPLVLAGLLYPAPRAAAQGCAAVDVVVARGTNEPGYLGSAVGDPLYAQLQRRLPMSLNGYRVNYPADLTNVLSVGDGSGDLVAHLSNEAVACPGQRFVLVGYSQGAVVVHTALGTGITGALPGAVRMNGALGSRVAAILLFGDPLRLAGSGVPGQYAARTANYCMPGDPVCANGLNPAAHVAYGGDFVAAADFTADRL